MTVKVKGRGQRSKSVKINIKVKSPIILSLLCKIVDFCKVYWSPRFVTLQNRRFLQSILVTTVCLSVCLFVCLLLCKIVDFCKVYWSPRSVCLFVTLQNRRFLQSILVTAVCLSVCLCVCLSVCLCVCLSVCLFVRLFAMYRPHHWTDLPDFLTCDVFWFKYDPDLFFLKSDKSQGQGHHFCENHLMGHNF